MMNNDLISRAEAIDIIRSMTISLGGKEIFHPEAKKSVVGALDEIAAIDAEPVRHAKWHYMRVARYNMPIDCRIRCANCGAIFARLDGMNYRFCPNCGTKMYEEGSE